MKSSFIITSLLASVNAFIPSSTVMKAPMTTMMSSWEPNINKPMITPRSSFSLLRTKNANPFGIIANPDRIMKEFFDDWESMSAPSEIAQALTLDVKESPTHYDLYLDAPGVDKEATKIEIKDHILTVTIERKAMDETENEKFRRVERFIGTSSRSLRLAEDVDENNVEASYNRCITNSHSQERS